VDTIGQQKLWTFLAGANRSVVANCTQIRKGDGHRVADYMELVAKIAELQFMNRDHVLLYRGQNADHHNDKGNTTLKPSLLRASNGKNPDQATLTARFDILKRAENLLIGEYEQRSLLGRDRLKRQQILRWSILQHYEVCATPLLDVTHSLRIAASFASDRAGSEAFIFVVGVPNLSGAITASAEAGLQIVRLSSVCPPTALRPHIQEGYLLGEYPELTGYDQKQYYANFEIDFGRRLVAKFRFNPRSFWKKRLFPKVERTALYPDRNDPLFALAESLRGSLAS
jgi:hypothetical protein